MYQEYKLCLDGRFYFGGEKNHSMPFITRLTRHLLVFHLGNGSCFFFFLCHVCHAFGGAAVQTCCQAWPEKCISAQRAFAFSSMIAVCPVFPSIFSIFKPLQLSVTYKASGILAGDRCCRQTVNKFFTFPSAVPKHNFFYVVVTEARLDVRTQIMRYHTVRPLKC